MNKIKGPGGPMQIIVYAVKLGAIEYRPNG